METRSDSSFERETPTQQNNKNGQITQNTKSVPSKLAQLIYQEPDNESDSNFDSLQTLTEPLTRAEFEKNLLSSGLKSQNHYSGNYENVNQISSTLDQFGVRIGDLPPLPSKRQAQSLPQSNYDHNSRNPGDQMGDVEGNRPGPSLGIDNFQTPTYEERKMKFNQWDQVQRIMKSSQEAGKEFIGRGGMGLGLETPNPMGSEFKKQGPKSKTEPKRQGLIRDAHPGPRDSWNWGSRQKSNNDPDLEKSDFTDNQYSDITLTHKNLGHYPSQDMIIEERTFEDGSETAMTLDSELIVKGNRSKMFANRRQNIASQSVNIVKGQTASLEQVSRMHLEKDLLSESVNLPKRDGKWNAPGLNQQLNDTKWNKSTNFQKKVVVPELENNEDAPMSTPDDLGKELDERLQAMQLDVVRLEDASSSNLTESNNDFRSTAKTKSQFKLTLKENLFSEVFEEAHGDSKNKSQVSNFGTGDFKILTTPNPQISDAKEDSISDVKIPFENSESKTSQNEDSFNLSVQNKNNKDKLEFQNRRNNWGLKIGIKGIGNSISNPGSKSSHRSELFAYEGSGDILEFGSGRVNSSFSNDESMEDGPHKQKSKKSIPDPHDKPREKITKAADFETFEGEYKRPKSDQQNEKFSVASGEKMEFEAPKSEISENKKSYKFSEKFSKSEKFSDRVTSEDNKTNSVSHPKSPGKQNDVVFVRKRKTKRKKSRKVKGQSNHSGFSNFSGDFSIRTKSPSSSRRSASVLSSPKNLQSLHSSGSKWRHEKMSSKLTKSSGKKTKNTDKVSHDLIDDLVLQNIIKASKSSGNQSLHSGSDNKSPNRLEIQMKNRTEMLDRRVRESIEQSKENLERHFHKMNANLGWDGDLSEQTVGESSGLSPETELKNSDFTPEIGEEKNLENSTAKKIKLLLSKADHDLKNENSIPPNISQSLKGKKLVPLLGVEKEQVEVRNSSEGSNNEIEKEYYETKEQTKVQNQDPKISNCARDQIYRGCLQDQKVQDSGEIKTRNKMMESEQVGDSILTDLSEERDLKLSALQRFKDNFNSGDLGTIKSTSKKQMEEIEEQNEHSSHRKGNAITKPEYEGNEDKTRWDQGVITIGGKNSNQIRQGKKLDISRPEIDSGSKAKIKMSRYNHFVESHFEDYIDQSKASGVQDPKLGAHEMINIGDTFAEEIIEFGGRESPEPEKIHQNLKNKTLDSLVNRILHTRQFAPAGLGLPSEKQESGQEHQKAKNNENESNLKFDDIMKNGSGWGDLAQEYASRNRKDSGNTRDIFAVSPEVIKREGASNQSKDLGKVKEDIISKTIDESKTKNLRMSDSIKKDIWWEKKKQGKNEFYISPSGTDDEEIKKDIIDTKSESEIRQMRRNTKNMISQYSNAQKISKKSFEHLKLSDSKQFEHSNQPGTRPQDSDSTSRARTNTDRYGFNATEFNANFGSFGLTQEMATERLAQRQEKIQKTKPLLESQNQPGQHYYETENAAGLTMKDDSEDEELSKKGKEIFYSQNANVNKLKTEKKVKTMTINLKFGETQQDLLGKTEGELVGIEEQRESRGSPGRIGEKKAKLALTSEISTRLEEYIRKEEEAKAKSGAKQKNAKSVSHGQGLGSKIDLAIEEDGQYEPPVIIRSKKKTRNFESIDLKNKEKRDNFKIENSLDIEAEGSEEGSIDLAENVVRRPTFTSKHSNSQSSESRKQKFSEAKKNREKYLNQIKNLKIYHGPSDDDEPLKSNRASPSSSPRPVSKKKQRKSPVSRNEKLNHSPDRSPTPKSHKKTSQLTERDSSKKNENFISGVSGHMSGTRGFGVLNFTRKPGNLENEKETRDVIYDKSDQNAGQEAKRLADENKFLRRKKESLEEELLGFQAKLDEIEKKEFLMELRSEKLLDGVAESLGPTFSNVFMNEMETKKREFRRLERNGETVGVAHLYRWETKPYQENPQEKPPTMLEIAGNHNERKWEGKRQFSEIDQVNRLTNQNLLRLTHNQDFVANDGGQIPSQSYLEIYKGNKNPHKPKGRQSQQSQIYYDPDIESDEDTKMDISIHSKIIEESRRKLQAESKFPAGKLQEKILGFNKTPIFRHENAKMKVGSYQNDPRMPPIDWDGQIQSQVKLTQKSVPGFAGESPERIIGVIEEVSELRNSQTLRSSRKFKKYSDQMSNSAISNSSSRVMERLKGKGNKEPEKKRKLMAFFNIPNGNTPLQGKFRGRQENHRQTGTYFLDNMGESNIKKSKFENKKFKDFDRRNEETNFPVRKERRIGRDLSPEETWESENVDRKYYRAELAGDRRQHHTTGTRMIKSKYEQIISGKADLIRKTQHRDKITNRSFNKPPKPAKKVSKWKRNRYSKQNENKKVFKQIQQMICDF